MSLSLDRALRKAKRHIKKGELRLAEHEYTTILAKHPNHKLAIDGLKALQTSKIEDVATSPQSPQHQIDALIALYHQGSLEDCLVQGKALAHQFPSIPFFPNFLGVVKAALGHLNEAVANYTKALELNPHYAEAHNNLGVALLELTRSEEAVACFHRAIHCVPDYLEAHNNLGNALKNIGSLEEAARSYKTALNIAPDHAQAHNNLGTALSELGRPEEAIVNYRRAVQTKSDYVEAYNNLGAALHLLGKHEEAVDTFNEALGLAPNYADAHNNLGACLSSLRRPQEAEHHFRTALQIKPDYEQAYVNLAATLNEIERYDEAIATCYDILKTNPRHAQVHVILGHAQKYLGKFEETVSSCRKALDINPDYAEAHCNLGNILKDLGNSEEAMASYHRALQIKPDYTEAHKGISNLTPYHNNDPHMHQMLKLVERIDLPDHERLHLHFALGKAYADIGDHDSAFEHVRAGNQICGEQTAYDISTTRDDFENIKSFFSSALPSCDINNQFTTNDAYRPIFILGMPRSGTTLVEQILASHSHVHGSGELTLLSQAIDGVQWSSQTSPCANFASIRDSYLSGLKNIGISKRYTTDKMPSNFRLSGFIKVAFPEAKIIHVKRDARAICWSNYKLYFPQQSFGYSHDMCKVAEYYKLYAELMSFWHEKYPGLIYDLDYEVLTEQQEDQTRQLLDYIGLQWEQQCLDFYKTKRLVHTASATQVRRKMYKGSSQEWRKFERHLQPMIDLLEGY